MKKNYSQPKLTVLLMEATNILASSDTDELKATSKQKANSGTIFSNKRDNETTSGIW